MRPRFRGTVRRAAPAPVASRASRASRVLLGLLVPALAVLAALLAVIVPATSQTALADPGPSPSPTATPALTLTATPASVVAGVATVLKASLGIADATLELSGEAAGESAFTHLAYATTGADGSATFSEEPTATTVYRVDFAGDSDWASAFATVAVRVRPRVTLAGPTAVFGWRKIGFTVTVSPQRPGAAVVLQRRRDNRWTTWRILTLGSDSRAVCRFLAKNVGRFSYRVTIAADAAHAAGTSSPVVVKVKSPNAYHVPLSPAHYILVDKSQYKLYYLEHGWVVRVFDCVLGRPALPTPLGHFHIYAKDPRMGGPYGPRRMRYHGLYAIHGTDEPWLLKRFPRNYSHGCTRLSDAHILWSGRRSRSR